jgi:hypothetical protein
MFDRSAFAYQPQTDTYICPAGHVLTRKQLSRRDALILYAARDCTGCSLKPRCTTAERRIVSRHLHEEALERMNGRLQADPTLIRQRRCASEHPFGTIKRMTAGGRFLARGLQKASGEAALSVLALQYHPGHQHRRRRRPSDEPRLSLAKRPRKTGAFDFSRGLRNGAFFSSTGCLPMVRGRRIRISKPLEPRPL